MINLIQTNDNLNNKTIENTKQDINIKDDTKKKMETLLEFNEYEDAPNRLLLHLDVTTDKFSNMILDTGSAGSLLKLGALKQGVEINADETFFLNGINQGKSIETLGKVLVKISLNEEVQIEHEFNIVPNDFPIEAGMLGRDFFKKFKTDLLYGDDKIRIRHSPTEYVYFPMSISQNSTLIAARTEMFIRVSTSFKEDVVSLAEELVPNVFTGNCIVKPKNGAAYISVINANDTDVILGKTPSFVPLKQFDVLYTTTTKNENSNQIEKTERFHIVKDLIEKNLSPDLNIEERNELLSIIENNIDLFHLDGDVLSCTTKYKHSTPTFSNIEPVYIKPHRIPQTQKKIVDEEVERILREGIMQHSTSPWNFPLLLVSKNHRS